MKEARTNFIQAMLYCYQQFRDDRCQVVAGALTLQTLFAIVPAITIAYVSLATFEGLGFMDTTVEARLFAFIVPESVGAVRAYIEQFSAQARSLSVPSGILLGLTAFLMLGTIERTLNDIWRVESPRSGLGRWLIYLGLLTLGPVLLFAGLTASIYVLSTPYFEILARWQPLLFIFPLLTSSLMYTALYYWVPSAKVRFRHSLLGGIGVAVIFDVARLGFALVMQYSSITLVYGAFAVLPGLLLWVYLAWLIILGGAEVVAFLGKNTAGYVPAKQRTNA